MTLCLGGFLFLTGASFCAWKVLCSSLVQASVPGRFSAPHLCRCLCLGGSLFLTCDCASAAPQTFLVCPYVGSSVCRFLCLGGYLCLTGAGFYLAFNNHIVLLLATTLWPTSHTMPIGSASPLAIVGVAPHSDGSVQSTHLITNDNSTH